jgi:hypothetical protein
MALLTNAKARGAADGLLVGAGLRLLPGRIIEPRRPGTGDLNPFPWLVAGFILVAFPLAHSLRILRLRRTQRRRDVF